MNVDPHILLVGLLLALAAVLYWFLHLARKERDHYFVLLKKDNRVGLVLRQGELHRVITGPDEPDITVTVTKYGHLAKVYFVNPQEKKHGHPH